MIELFDLALFNSTFRMIAPILLAALGGLICERVLVFNIILEGTMLIGAFVAVTVSYFMSSSLAGVAAAALAGMLFSLLLAVLVVTLKGDAIVIGIAMNMLASGLTTFLLRKIFGVKGQFTDPNIVSLPRWDIPLIKDIPILGDIISGHSWVVYLSWVLVIVVYFLLFRHIFGLRMRGVGQNDEAARTLGVNVAWVRYAALAICGLLVGIAGAQLSLGQVTLYVENMSAGRGWIAVVAVMLGNAHPFGVFFASLLFGFSDALGYRLQGSMLPYQFAGMIPYVVTLLAVFVNQSRKKNKRFGYS
jgi:general nucleoside transport system permease protein